MTPCQDCGRDPCMCPPSHLAIVGLNEAIERMRKIENHWRRSQPDEQRQAVLALAIFADQVKQAATALGNILGQSGVKR